MAAIEEKTYPAHCCYYTEGYNFIPKIKDEFNKQYKNMQEAKILDMETEIKMFESTSGVTKENVEVGGKDE